MSMGLRALNLLGRLRRRLRLRLWVARTRLALLREGCELEVRVGRGVAFHTPPVVEPTRQVSDEREGGKPRGRLRLDIGDWVHLGSELVIEVAPGRDGAIVLGDGVRLGTAVRLVAAGGRVGVGSWSDVRDGVVLKSTGDLEIEGHTVISYHALVHCAEAVAIGRHALVSERVSIIDSDHEVDGSDTRMLDRPVRAEPVEIGRNSWIGANSVVLRGVRLGANAVVAAGSVVRAGDYPGGWVVAGSPATAKRSLRAAPEEPPR